MSTINVNLDLNLRDLTREIVFNCSKGDIIEFMTELSELACDIDPTFKDELIRNLSPIQQS